MFRLEAEKPARFCDGLRRRDFLHAGALSFLGLGLSELFGLKAQGAADTSREVNCILLFLVGGPSQLDTWDPKPGAPAEIRGPYKAIKTNVSGIEVTEIFARMAKHADKYALIRSVYHTAAAVHDTGHQMMQTGRLFQAGLEYPHIGSVLSKVKGPKGDAPPHVLLPRPIGNTGGNLPHGQTAGFLGKSYDPLVLNADTSAADFKVPDLRRPHYIASLRLGARRTWRQMVEGSLGCFESSRDARLLDSSFHQAYTLMASQKAREAFDLHREPDAVREKYGRNRFGQSCLLARRLIQAGVRFVTINMFDAVFNEPTWDIHGSKPFSPISCYRDLIGPMFDNAYCSLLEELDERGLLDSTLVVAMGEFGRTPRINPAGGRDHWPQCWTILMAGGGVQGGQVVGASDELGAYPKQRPVTPAEVAATIYKALGISLEMKVPGLQGQPIPLLDRGAEPIRELFSA